MVPSPPSWLQQWSEIFAGVFTAVLTVFLVVLYKRQTRQLEARHEALLEITNVEWYGDRAIIWISNFGNGVAKNLRLTTLVKSDTGDQRNHVVRSNSLKRIDKEGEWTNLIQPGEEDVPFHGTSQVGKPAPRNWPGDWISFKFSNFVRMARENGSTQVKYAHVVQGAELSDNSCWDRINPMTESVTPQDFDGNHSLGNLPRKTQHGLDNTFNRYFRSSIFWASVLRFYIFFIRLLDRIIPRLKLRPRHLDASGTRRVKRVLLKRDLKQYYRKLRSKLVSGTHWVGSKIPYAKYVHSRLKNNQKLDTYLLVGILFAGSLALGDYGSRFYIYILQVSVPSQIVAALSEPITTKLIPAIVVVWVHQWNDVPLFHLQNHPYWFAFVGGISLGIFERILFIIVRGASISPEFLVAPWIHALNAVLIGGAIFSSVDNLEGFRFFVKLLAVTVAAMAIHLFWNTFGVLFVHQTF